MASFDEIVNKLLSGEKIAWDEKSIQLDTAGQRRLFEFLYKLPESKVQDPPEDIFDDLISAWKNEGSDPAENTKQNTAMLATGTYRLYRVETNNFGGLNSYGGEPFIFEVGGDSWALEGQNGSGKTSLVKAILWAMTGYSIREHLGPVKDDGRREDVSDNEDNKIGAWPPLVAYPNDKAQLKEKAELSVKLTFKDENNNEAIAERKIISFVGREPSVEENIDARLQISSSLVEAGLLMPARLTTISFGKNSQKLYDSVKMLTGFDRLGFIGDGAAALTHGSKKFLKYDRDKGIKKIEKDFIERREKVKQSANDINFTLPSNIDIATNNIINDLITSFQEASQQATQYAKDLQGKINSSVDAKTPEGRRKVSDAIGASKQVAGEVTNKIPAFADLRALSEAKGLDGVNSIIEEVEEELSIALKWHKKQEKDEKFQLKALAAKYFKDTQQPARCPLCNAKLIEKKLAEQLKELKEESKKAARKLDHACAQLRRKLEQSIPESLRDHINNLFKLEPKTAIVEGARKIFVTSEPFSNVLEGAKKAMENHISRTEKDLPGFDCKTKEKTPNEEPDSLQEERQYIASLQRIFALAEWWGKNKQTFVDWWKCIAGDGGVLKSGLLTIEEALEKAKPLDEIAKLLTEMADLAKQCHDIQEVQKVREDIAEALKPLKELRTYVDSQAEQSIEELSEKIETIRARIHLTETLKYKGVDAKKKQVLLHGGFTDDMEFDALPVANTSWHRAILWAFIFALRDKTIEELGYNPFPLLVLDDPQMTFDARNERDWAAELVGLAREDGNAQILCSANNHDFNKMLTGRESSSFNQAKVVSVKLGQGKSQVISGNEVERAFKECIDNNDDERACDYIYKARSYIENLIKIMLRGLGVQKERAPLKNLVQELRNLGARNEMPFNKSAFKDLLSCFDKNLETQLLNSATHERPENIGVSQAEQFHQYWKNTLEKKLDKAFDAYFDYHSFQGDSQVYDYPENVISLPIGQANNLRQIALHKTGIAAAARTDGHAGDGVITIEDLKAEEVKLQDHDIYRVTSETLLPVVGFDDYVIVSNHGEVNPKNLIVAAVGDRLLLRRYNVSEDNPEIAVLTAQTIDPYAIAEPVITPIKDLERRKVIGTLFTQKNISTENGNHEIQEVKEEHEYRGILENACLFGVKGQSAEPIALEGQYLIVGNPLKGSTEIKQYNNRLVVAFDKDGAGYFKRLRISNSLLILESLNPDGNHPAVLLSLNEEKKYPQFEKLLPVLGVLFDLPSS